MGTMWFLTSYFFCCVIFEIVMFLFIKKQGGELITFIIFLSLAIIGALLGNFINLSYGFPWGIDISLASQLFPYFGYIFKKYIMQMIDKKKILGPVLMLLCFGLCFITFKGAASTSSGYVKMAVGEYGNFAAFLITGCAGTALMAMVSYYAVKIKFVKNIIVFIGQQSLFIMITHREFSWFVKDHFVENTFIFALAAFAITIFLAVISYVVSSLLPFMVGKYGKTSIKLFHKEIQLIK